MTYLDHQERRKLKHRHLYLVQDQMLFPMTRSASQLHVVVFLYDCLRGRKILSVQSLVEIYLVQILTNRFLYKLIIDKFPKTIEFCGWNFNKF